MEIEGNLLKMRTEFSSPVNYYLRAGENEVLLNRLLNTEIRLEFSGMINCVKCGTRTKKSYNQGFCFQCMQTAPESDPCIIHPEKSMAQFGIARDMDWAVLHDLIPHVVYLSLTSGLKVGVTRHNQIPVRWIDQGAIKAIKLAQTPNRHIAGVIEKFLRQFVADKTNWKQMLLNPFDASTNLVDEKQRIVQLLHQELKQYVMPDDTVQEIIYPGEFDFQTLDALTFDKQKLIEGKLIAIKGQYLIFSNNTCINIRKHTAYYVNVCYDKNI